MKKNSELLQPDAVYHVYNRGINGEDVFKQYRNYRYFLEKYATYIEPIAKTFACCLLKNHFHIAIRTKSEEEILAFYTLKHPTKTEYPSASHIIGQQFAHLFSGYAQAINKSDKRTGGLFEEPFRRILVENDVYLRELIIYIHRNPQKQRFVEDFRDYEHSSYHSFLREGKTKLPREEILELFGNKSEFIKFHESTTDSPNTEKFDIEF